MPLGSSYLPWGLIEYRYSMGSQSSRGQGGKPWLWEEPQLRRWQASRRRRIGFVGRGPRLPSSGAPLTSNMQFFFWKALSMMLVLGFCHPAIRRGLAAAPAAAQPPRPLRENLPATLKKLSDADKFDIAERASRCASEIAYLIVDIEALGPKVAWSFGTITNDCHVGSP